jgi:RecA-family ATPase
MSQIRIVDDPDLQPVIELPQIMSLGLLIENYPTLRPIILDGFLREGETANIIAASKAGKSFLALGLALSVATGQPWLGRNSKRSRVLLIDNELHKQTLSSRVSAVAKAMNVNQEEISEGVDVLPLRGHLIDLEGLQRSICEIQVGTYGLIVLDALYRMLPQGTNESDNAQITALYNLIDVYSAQIGAAFVVVHHASKGSQLGKNVIDIGSGAGAISRAADAHLTIREHESEGLCVLEGVARSFKSPEPATLQYEYPLWSLVEDVQPLVNNPAAKKDSQKRNKKEREDRQEIDKLLALCGTKPILKTKLRDKTGLTNDRFARLLAKAEQAGAVEIKKVRKKNKDGNKSKRPNFLVHRKFMNLDQASGGVQAVPWQPDSTPSLNQSLNYGLD